MRNIRWYYLLAFVLGGLALLSVTYLLLRASGLIYRITARNTDWIDFGE
ncbi:MAG: hypothetical protein ACE5FH_03955 [Candidatus Zixiibacteriota bacterium]